MSILRRTSACGFALAAAIMLAACSSAAKQAKLLAPEGEFHMAGAIPGVKPNVGELAIQTSRSMGENGLARAVAFCAADDGDGYTVSLFRGSQCIFRDIPARFVMNGKFSGAEIQTGDLLWWNRVEHAASKPAEDAGEFYMMGHVARPGVYDLAAPITLKQAILGADFGIYLMSMPRSLELIRRVGENEEITQRYKLDDLIRGETVDLQILPNDVLNIGTDVKTVCLYIPPREKMPDDMKRRDLLTELHFSEMCLPQYEAELTRLEVQRAALRKIAASDAANPRAIAAAKSAAEYFDHQIEKVRTARDALQTQIRQNKIEIEKLNLH